MRERTIGLVVHSGKGASDGLDDLYDVLANGLAQERSHPGLTIAN